MKPEVLEYRSPPAPGEQPRHRWVHQFAFPLACALAFIALAAGLFASLMLFNVFAYAGPNGFEAAALMLFVVGVPLIFLLLITSAVTIALGSGKSSKPWGRARLLTVFVPQALAILLPVAVTLIYGHRL